MRLRHIEVFHAIYTTGSVTNAAKMLHVSQPSVSKVLSHAEMQLGFRLFNRVKGRLVPTDEAVLLFEEVDRVYRQLNTINDAAENIKNKEVGRISLALTPALGFDLIPQTVAQFRQKHPKITFDIQTLHNDQLQKHLLRHKSELAIMFAPENLSGINEIFFGTGKLVAVYPRSLLPHCPKTISLSQVIEHPLVSIWNSGPLANLIWREMMEQQLQPSTAVKVQTYFIAVNLVKHGAGICIVDEFTARGQQNDETGIAELAESLEFPIKGLYLENKPLSHATQDFLETLKKKF
ncbi:LysR family transcriptional regulator [Aliikangiella coralliicola]|uniref:LysR family transcriptional regulator n=1 Tax=Aliikangiella coralliicola TaxID=2592383 RepID=A0A545UCI9_9GAMM|nr:LysR family transcriptional regulator [Aliikangiella coralliicola]TQV87176.1 LysR family transcriptional regulator [Aliikangiella coralliicola]